MSSHGGDILSYKETYGKKPIDFSANTSPLNLPEEVKKAIINSVDDIPEYPDPHCRELLSAISKKIEVPKEYLICGNGAADLIFKLVFAVKPKKALICSPTFSEYENALSAQNCMIKYYELKKETNFAISEDFLKYITSDTDMVFVCQPNNPTGQITSKDLLVKIAKKCKENNCVFALDECFVDFLDEAEENSLIDLAKDFSNMFIFKAFTKFYAMAGIRLGYAITSNSVLIEKIKQCSQAWSVSNLAQSAGIVALQQDEYGKRLKDLIKKEREFLCAELDRLKIFYFKPQANFIFFSTQIEDFDIKLKEKGILIRSCANYKALSKSYYRIAVKSHEDNQALIKAMEEIIL